MAFLVMYGDEFIDEKRYNKMIFGLFVVFSIGFISGVQIFIENRNHKRINEQIEEIVRVRLEYSSDVNVTPPPEETPLATVALNVTCLDTFKCCSAVVIGFFVASAMTFFLMWLLFSAVMYVEMSISSFAAYTLRKIIGFLTLAILHVPFLKWAMQNYRYLRKGNTSNAETHLLWPRDHIQIDSVEIITTDHFLPTIACGPFVEIKV